MANIWMDFHNMVELRGNKVVTFHIEGKDGNSLGRLRLGRGYVRYFRPGKGPRKPVKIAWENFVEQLLQQSQD